MSRRSTSLSLRITPCPTVSIPRRPALPMSWVSSPLVSDAKLSPSNFVELEGYALPLVLVAQRLHALGDRDVDALLLVIIGEVDSVYTATLQRLTASPPREDEVDGGEHRAPAEHVDDLEHVVVRRASGLTKSRLLHRIRLGKLERPACGVACPVEERVQRVVDGEPH